MTTKTRRIEARLDESTADLLARAAERRHESLSAFVVRAARAEAELVLARHDETPMPVEQFDRMVDALGARPVPNAALAEVAGRERRFTRHR